MANISLKSGDDRFQPTSGIFRPMSGISVRLRMGGRVWWGIPADERYAEGDERYKEADERS